MHYKYATRSAAQLSAVEEEEELHAAHRVTLSHSAVPRQRRRRTPCHGHWPACRHWHAANDARVPRAVRWTASASRCMHSIPFAWCCSGVPSGVRELPSPAVPPARACESGASRSLPRSGTSTGTRPDTQFTQGHASTHTLALPPRCLATGVETGPGRADSRG